LTPAEPDVRLVLVETSHPGNIGAAARAMKTMGLGTLVLVRPARFPHADATARAAGADDVLARATVTASLDEALAECGFVVATSARDRHIEWPQMDVREFASSAVGPWRSFSAVRTRVSATGNSIVVRR
jgi:TrmH family RNA methyltransferase